MHKRIIRLQFDGEVQVQMPDNVPGELLEDLEQNIALSKILATTDNPDACEDQACEDYLQHPLANEHHWDDSSAHVVSEVWQIARD